MRINILHLEPLKRHTFVFKGDEPELQELYSGFLRSNELLSATLSIERKDLGIVNVLGKVTFRATLPCSLCGETCQIAIDEKINLCFDETPRVPATREIDLSADQLMEMSLDHGYLDLALLLNEEIWLALPSTPKHADHECQKSDKIDRAPETNRPFAKLAELFPS